MSKRQGRGQLTDRIKQKSIELLGYEITTTELRLIPYLQYVLVNRQAIDLARINKAEMGILSKLVDKGYIIDGITQGGRPMLSDGALLCVTKTFWDAISEILWLGYVDLYEGDGK